MKGWMSGAEVMDRGVLSFVSAGVHERERRHTGTVRGSEGICGAIDGRIGGLRCCLYVLLSLPLVS